MMLRCSERLLLSETVNMKDFSFINHIKVKSFPDGAIMIWIYTSETKKGFLLTGENKEKFKKFIERC